MFRASSLLLISIIFTTLLGSSTPRPVTAVLSSEEAGSEELAPVSQDHGHLDVDQLQKDLSPAVAGEAAVSHEEPTIQEDNTRTVTPPEYPMPDDTKGAEVQDADTVEPLTSDQEEVTKVNAASDETGPAEISPDGTLQEVDPTGALEGIPAEDWSQTSAIPAEASDETHANGETEEDSLSLSKEEDKHIMFVTEGASQEEAASEQFASQQPAVEVPGGLTDTEVDQEEASPALLSESEGEEETSEAGAEENTEVAPTDEDTPPVVSTEDESDVSLALDAQLESAEDETAVEELVVLPDDSEELDEMIPKASAESADQEASEEHEQLETEENAEQNSLDSISLLEDDETVAVISDVDEESREDPAATVLSTMEEVEEMVQEEADLSAPHQEGSEVTEVPTPNSPNDGDALVVEEEVIFMSNTDENNQDGAIAAATLSSPLEESEEVLEEMVPSVSAGTFHQEPSKETDVEAEVTSTPNVVAAAPEEDQTLALTFEVLATEEPPEDPVPEDIVLIVVMEDRGKNSDNIQSEEATAQPEDTETSELVVLGTAAAQEVQEPALVNRGAVLGAALFTLVSFITMGFIWTTVAKKLR